KALQWVMNGAQPTDTVKAMLSYRGILYRKHLAIGVAKGAIKQEDADKKLADCKQAKESKIQSTKDNLTQSKEAQAKARKEAESKVREARAEASRQKQKAAEAAATEQAPAPETEAEAPAAEDETQA